MPVSILNAWHEGEWTLADVQPTLQMLFDRQYTLTGNVVKERRYYIAYVRFHAARKRRQRPALYIPKTERPSPRIARNQRSSPDRRSDNGITEIHQRGPLVRRQIGMGAPCNTKYSLQCKQKKGYSAVTASGQRRKTFPPLLTHGHLGV